MDVLSSRQAKSTSSGIKSKQSVAELGGGGGLERAWPPPVI